MGHNEGPKPDGFYAVGAQHAQAESALKHASMEGAQGEAAGPDAEAAVPVNEDRYAFQEKLAADPDFRKSFLRLNDALVSSGEVD